MRNFEIHQKALLEKKRKDETETPKIPKSLNILKWIKDFYEILHRCIGVHNVPIAYVIREDAAVPTIAPALMSGYPHTI